MQLMAGSFITITSVSSSLLLSISIRIRTDRILPVIVVQSSSRGNIPYGQLTNGHEQGGANWAVARGTPRRWMLYSTLSHCEHPPCNSLILLLGLQRPSRFLLSKLLTKAASDSCGLSVQISSTVHGERRAPSLAPILTG